MKSELVVVTGASGFIAGYCILQLLEKGYRVRGTLRSLAKAAEVRSWIERGLSRNTPVDEFELIAADLESDDAWNEVMAGATFVLHVASPNPSRMPKDLNELLLPAREGTLRVMRTASNAGVKRVVQTSSLAAVFYGNDEPNRIFTEEDWSNVDHPGINAYSKSKVLAERAAWQELAKTHPHLEWVAILPGLVLGPVFNREGAASVQVIAKMMNGELPGTPRLNFCIVDLRDIADLHLRAMIAPEAAGQRFIGAGPLLSMAKIAEILRSGAGQDARKVPKRGLPDLLVKIVSFFDAEVRGQIHELGRERRASSDKATCELGWHMRPAAETILDTAKSLRDVGTIRG